MELFEKNIPSISAEESRILSEKTVFIAGCGGIGGYLAELSARCGIGCIILCDGDCFELSNMNRQLGCTAKTVGRPKAAVIKDRLLSINPELRVTEFKQRLDSKNAHSLLFGADIILDGLDSGKSRIDLENAAEALDIVIVHGAVSGWRGQISVVPPGSGIIKRLYSEDIAPSFSSTGCLSFAPAFCAAVQVSQAVKLLLGKDSDIYGKVMFADLNNFTFDTLII